MNGKELEGSKDRKLAFVGRKRHTLKAHLLNSPLVYSLSIRVGVAIQD